MRSRIRGRAGLARAAVLGAGVASILSGVLCAGGASAEVRRVEAVGTYGIQESARRRVIPRDEAIERGTWEAVSRVALELISESEPAGRGAEEGAPGDPRDEGSGVESSDAGVGELDDEAAARLRAALGGDMLPYTRSYRILEDRGEGPVLFAEQEGVDTEYVVVVEVLVDVDRVSAALEGAGLIRAATVGEDAESLELEVLGLARYQGFEALLSLLRGPIGATRVETLELSRARQLLAVEGPLGLEDLAIRLTELSGGGLALEPLAVDPIRGRIQLRARYVPPPEGEDPGSRPGARQP